MDWKARAGQLKVDLPAVFLALKQRETPVAAKVLAAVTVAYALSPIDLIPDFIPVLGLLDDAILLPALIALTIRLIPEDVFRRCRERAGDLWREGRPKRWYYALPVAAVWLALILILLRWRIKIQKTS